MEFPIKTLRPDLHIISEWWAHPHHNRRVSFDVNHLKSSPHMLAYEAPGGRLDGLPCDELQMSLVHI